MLHNPLLLNKPKLGHCLPQYNPLVIDVVKISALYNYHNLAMCLKPMPDREIALEYLKNARDHLGETD